MKKRILAVLLVVIVILGLCSCGQPDSTGQNGGSGQSDSIGESGGSDETVTVTWWVRGNKAEDHDKVMEALNEKLVEAINVKLDLVMIPGAEFDEKVRLASMGGENYDLVWTSNWSNSFRENVERNGFLPLEDLLEEYGQGIVDQMPEGLLGVSTVDGHIYAMPCLQILANQVGVYIQKEYADEFGLDLTHIDEIDELYPFFDWCVENYPDKYAIDTLGLPLLPLQPTEMVNGTTDEVRIDMTTNEVIMETDFYPYEKANEMYKKGYMQKDILTVTDNTTDMKAGNYISFLAIYKPGGDVETSLNYNRDYIVIPMGEATMEARAGITTMNAINVNSEHPEEAMKLYNLLYTDTELYNMLLFGIEGEHYEKDGDFRVIPKEDSKYNYGGSSWLFCNQFNTWYMPGQVEGTWEETIQMNNDAIKSRAQGFELDTSSITSEISQVSAVAQEFSRSYYIAEDFEEWKQDYEKRMDAAGLTKIREEVKAQFDAWKAENNK